ncbi:hypothetical protein QSI79_22850 [Enterobacter asburiae]|uniref:hypothetical protein n=1 Tax=Enterobacter asburiae TaxID=61645 RepID=UPI002878DF7C|nr:hypothetical protein [Enterobacter asburiae]MDS1916132.1 hypothetical protein [Enterobacter asburiae]
MKKLILVAGAMFAMTVLSGCAEMVAQQKAEAQKSYADIAKCESTIDYKPTANVEKGEFINGLQKEAAGASADGLIAKLKLDRLQIVGWDKQVADSVYACKTKNTEKRVSLVQESFNTLKTKEKNKDERNALISAYSAWETYVKTLTPEAKQDFDTKLSYYKNM